MSMSTLKTTLALTGGVLTAGALALTLAAAPALAAEATTPIGKDVPDLTGKWLNATPEAALKTSDGKAPPLNAKGTEEYAKNKKDKAAGMDPLTLCHMHGEPRLLFTKYPFLIMQYGNHVDFLHQANHTFRITYFGEKLDPDADPIWLGHPTAKWDGKTLVIDAAQYNAETWLDYTGLPHGEKLTTEERYTLSADGKTINGTVKITDPDYYSKPWTAAFTLKKQPGYSLEQYSCMADHKM
jgi:hypothetical protein